MKPTFHPLSLLILSLVFVSLACQGPTSTQTASNLNNLHPQKLQYKLPWSQQLLAHKEWEFYVLGRGQG